MPSSISPQLNADEQLLLLGLARETLRRTVTGAADPTFASCKLPPRLNASQGCFVTLTRDGQLRGCIGNVEPRWPLWRAVVENSRVAATQDSRFPPVRPEELESVEIEISVLTPPERLQFRSPEDLLAQLEPGRDGVLFGWGARRATYLPQVWEKLPDKTRFLSQLALKAGAGPDDWRRRDAVFHRYQVIHFSEGTVPPAEGTVDSGPGDGTGDPTDNPLA
jgi:AmmeMemoRadiSam system protein A